MTVTAKPQPAYALPFHTPHRSPLQAVYVTQALQHGHLRPNGPFFQRARSWLADHTGAGQVVLTNSCTAAMEIAALALELGPADEVIVPTFTFCASATAFERTGARIVFCDIDPSTMMLNPADLKRHLSNRTRVIVVTHYGGASAEMEAILVIAKKRGIQIVEDAAQGFGTTRADRPLGSFGAFGAYSFHETKVVSCGQGGALAVNTNDPALLDRVTSIVERGTDFARVRSGEKAFYEWTGPGSSFQMGELEAAILCAELEALQDNLAARRRIALKLLKGIAELSLPLSILTPDAQTNSNFHFVPVLARSASKAGDLIAHLQTCGIDCRQHYVPLHLSPRAKTKGYNREVLPAAEQTWDRMVRLPVHTDMSEQDVGTLLAALNAWMG
ncbi:aminotransferase class V-fold PLP-dependent enzyme [uncultured Nitratireductor sp.]|uniref:aminotransferase class V-fold PLP-dependent enzyme n=1 Tax=uncultured Nitratireductor sp. TaxID=520953 RepID=UPI00262388C8|nr:aminotransferase class V-fold PLP-dependent enzyme [uncultured Nitratireductor sp.]